MRDLVLRVVAVYLSGHGFGHAVRVAEVLRILLGRCVDVAVQVRGVAPRRLFPQSEGRIFFHAVETDVGMSQPNGLEIDLPATLVRLDELERS